MELSTQELKILKSSLNALISQRITYSVAISNEKKLEINEKQMKEEYELLDRVIKELDNAE
ncbi:hypothetical protein AB2T90_11345 [Clostridium butyricum]|uniref:hypothetical protein n=1 Tax=Clostridium butyricum TaxID=1492 RepID=UPI00346776E4